MLPQTKTPTSESPGWDKQDEQAGMHRMSNPLVGYYLG